jgi:hypothetical protein
MSCWEICWLLSFQAPSFGRLGMNWTQYRPPISIARTIESFLHSRAQPTLILVQCHPRNAFVAVLPPHSSPNQGLDL